MAASYPLTCKYLRLLTLFLDTWRCFHSLALHTVLQEEARACRFTRHSCVGREPCTLKCGTRGVCVPLAFGLAGGCPERMTADPDRQQHSALLADSLPLCAPATSCPRRRCRQAQLRQHAVRRGLFQPDEEEIPHISVWFSSVAHL